jgi:hypothetical protein
MVSKTEIRVQSSSRTLFMHVSIGEAFSGVVDKKKGFAISMVASQIF